MSLNSVRHIYGFAHLESRSRLESISSLDLDLDTDTCLESLKRSNLQSTPFEFYLWQELLGVAAIDFLYPLVCH